MNPVSVMLVDDNYTFLHIFANHLKEHWTGEIKVVGCAKNGEEALEKAAALKPHVILLDLVMPGLNGLELIPRLKTILPQARIIMLTLLDTPDYRQSALAAGADDFVAKENLESELRPAFDRIMRDLHSQSDATPVHLEIPPGPNSTSPDDAAPSR